MAQILRFRTTTFAVLFLLSLGPERVLAIDESSVAQQDSSASVDVVIASPPVTAVDPNQSAPPAANPEAPRQGDSIWLEEKIAPSTRWIENLVKPVTVWMERKIQTDRSQGKEPGHAPNSTPEDGNVGAPESGPKMSAAVSQKDIISVAQASAIATAVTPGNVLRVKLLERENERAKYRVKLISTRGEIHIVHIDAVTQELIAPAGSKEKL